MAYRVNVSLIEDDHYFNKKSLSFFPPFLDTLKINFNQNTFPAFIKGTSLRKSMTTVKVQPFHKRIALVVQLIQKVANYHLLNPNRKTSVLKDMDNIKFVITDKNDFEINILDSNIQHITHQDKLNDDFSALKNDMVIMASIISHLLNGQIPKVLRDTTLLHSIEKLLKRMSGVNSDNLRFMNVADFFSAVLEVAVCGEENILNSAKLTKVILLCHSAHADDTEIMCATNPDFANVILMLDKYHLLCPDVIQLLLIDNHLSELLSFSIDKKQYIDYLFLFVTTSEIVMEERKRADMTFNIIKKMIHSCETSAEYISLLAKLNEMAGKGFLNFLRPNYFEAATSETSVNQKPKNYWQDLMVLGYGKLKTLEEHEPLIPRQWDKYNRPSF